MYAFLASPFYAANKVFAFLGMLCLLISTLSALMYVSIRARGNR